MRHLHPKALCVDPESPLPLALRGGRAAPCLSPWAELPSSSGGCSVVFGPGTPEPVAPIQSRPRRPSALLLDTPCGLSAGTLWQHFRRAPVHFLTHISSRLFWLKPFLGSLPPPFGLEWKEEGQVPLRSASCCLAGTRSQCSPVVTQGSGWSRWGALPTPRVCCPVSRPGAATISGLVLGPCRPCPWPSPV